MVIILLAICFKFTGFLPPRADNLILVTTAAKHYTMRPAFLATFRKSKSMTKKLHIKTWGCQRTSTIHRRWPICWMPPTAINDRRGGRSGCTAAEHLLNPREAQEKVFHQLGRWKLLKEKNQT